MARSVERVLNFNIDNYLNPYIPQNFTSRLPRAVSRWFGHRPGQYKEPPALIVHFWAFLGSFIGLLLVGAVFKYAPDIARLSPPVLIASLGASAVLEYAAIQTPLAQPRNVLVGHGISAVIGVAISKAFQTRADFLDLQWIAASIACAVCTLVMSLTNTVHPPGGATAILACVEANVIKMGWNFVGVILLAVCLMLAVSLVNNNVMRRFPVYWWTPEETGQRWRRAEHDDEESQTEKDVDVQSETTLQHNSHHEDWHAGASEIHITAQEFRVPADVLLREEEIALLRELQLRIAKR